MLNRILAPLDGSKLSECTLNYIKEVAAGCHTSKVVLLTVLEPVVAQGDWWANREQIEKIGAEYQKKLSETKENAEKYLLKVSTALKKDGLDVDTIVLSESENGQVAEVIMGYAEENSIDLIVMSTHGRSGIARWAFGSVTDRVVHHAKTPVMTIIPTGCRM